MTPPRPAVRRVLTSVSVLALATTAACGLDDEQQEVADQIRTAISGGDDSSQERDLATCTAERWVGEVGLGRLRQDGIVTGEQDVRADAARATVAGSGQVSRETAVGYARARVSCLDFDLLAEQEAPDASQTARVGFSDCLADIDDRLREEAITEQLVGNGGAMPVTRLQRQEARCADQLQG